MWQRAKIRSHSLRWRWPDFQSDQVAELLCAQDISLSRTKLLLIIHGSMEPNGVVNTAQVQEENSGQWQEER